MAHRLAVDTTPVILGGKIINGSTWTIPQSLRFQRRTWSWMTEHTNITISQAIRLLTFCFISEVRVLEKNYHKKLLLLNIQRLLYNVKSLLLCREKQYYVMYVKGRGYFAPWHESFLPVTCEVGVLKLGISGYLPPWDLSWYPASIMTMPSAETSVQFTVGKLDAGMVNICST